MATEFSLDTPLQACLRLHSRSRQALDRLGLKTLGELLRHLPRRYEDRRHLKPIRSLRSGDHTTVWGKILTIRQRRTRSGKFLLEAVLGDDSGEIQLAWFQQTYLSEVLRPGQTGYFYGEVKLRKGLQMVAPEFELDEPEPDGPDGGRGGPESGSGSAKTIQEPSLNMRRIVPIYPATQGFYQRTMRRWMATALQTGVLDQLEEGPFPLLGGKSTTLGEAYRSIHFPPSQEKLSAARARLIFEEYFLFASRLHLRRRRFKAAGGARFQITPDLDRKIRALFPFTLTPDQDRAIVEITGDLGGPSPMYRLLEGDVGTGKTAVALYALLAAVRNGYQGAILAPTEVLAEQHHRYFSTLLSRHARVKIDLLTGSSGASARRDVLEGLASGKTHLAVGTHALFQPGVKFRRLGLAIIDEQHRFGVLERAQLRQKGENIHLLVMSATPIPRSLCLTAYGDLDLSVLKERPPGRSPVRTLLVSPGRKERAMEFIAGELERGKQAYFIYPLIEASEALEAPAALEAHGRIEKRFPKWSTGLLHGRMPAEEKDVCLRRFRDKECQILVSTVVVEVGIDVPNATVLYIEDATRFGLAQLHQLRGRVGRGADPGYCLIGLPGPGKEARSRLEVFSKTQDGFQIAAEDLRLRGPGDFLGVRQSGWPRFLIGNPLEDLGRFQEIRKLAELFWEEPRFAAEAGRYLERFPDLADPLGSDPDAGVRPALRANPRATRSISSGRRIGSAGESRRETRDPP